MLGSGVHQDLNDFYIHQTWLITQDGSIKSPHHHGAIARVDSRR